jgi:GST-like protein
MADLSAFPITRKWPVQDPSKLQLFSYPTPNGIKASCMLEECGLPYEPHRVTLEDANVRSPEFLSLNPNNKIPAIIDPDGPEGRPLGLFESGAILIYLSEKTGLFGGTSPANRLEVIQWLMFQMGGVGPMLGQLGFFVKFGGSAVEDPIPRERYVAEARRLLAVVDGALDGKEWIAGAYSIADMALCPWLNALEFYGAKDMVGYHELRNVPAYVDRFWARPAASRARNIPPR